MKQAVHKKKRRPRVVDALGIQNGLEKVVNTLSPPVEGGEGAEGYDEEGFEDEGEEEEEEVWRIQKAKKPSTPFSRRRRYEWRY